MQEPTDEAKQIKQMTKDTDRKQLQEKQQQNSLHAWYVLCSKSAYVERKRTRQCLRSAGIKAEKEEFILASQEQLLSTRNYQGNILTNEADPKVEFVMNIMKPFIALSPDISCPLQSSTKLEIIFSGSINISEQMTTRITSLGPSC